MQDGKKGGPLESHQEPSEPPHFRPAVPQSVARKTEVGKQPYCHTNAVDSRASSNPVVPFPEVSASETSQWLLQPPCWPCAKKEHCGEGHKEVALPHTPQIQRIRGRG